MDKKEFKNYFDSKSMLWQQAFCDLYVGKHNLYQLKKDTGFEPELPDRILNNVNDVSELCKLARYIDSIENKLFVTIGSYRYNRPLSWQYDFVMEVVKELKLHEPTELNMFAVIDAYCAASLSDKIDLPNLTAKLDARYAEIFASVTRKTNLLKRNFSLVLENEVSAYGCNSSGLNCRELVERYIKRLGINGLAKALKAARTADIKLTPEERACLGYSYYSSYFDSEEADVNGILLGDNLFFCVENRLKKEAEYRQMLKENLRPIGYDDDDDDDDDEAEHELKKTHSLVFVDPQDRCLLDVQYGEVPYAHVYIEKIKNDDLNNSLPDFIRCNHGYLYTVEFIDNLDKLPLARRFLRYVSKIKAEMFELQKSGIRARIKQRYAELCEKLEKCYCISE